MKHYPGTFIIALLGLLVTGACKKSKTGPERTGELPTITLTKAADDNTGWTLNIDAAAADRAGLWIDLNSNGVKDNGEAFTKFSMDLGSQNSFALGASKTVGIYGRVTKLGCYLNELTSVDLSRSITLEELDCSANRLASLNVSANTALTVLDCGNNELETLDVSKNTALEDLTCHNNDFTTLNLSQNTALISLFCLNNQLTSLDLSHNKKLKRLICNINELTALDLSQNTDIREVDLSRNQINNANMKQLINSLPARAAADKGDLYLLYPPDDNSRPDATDIANGRSKNWVLFEMQGSWKEIL